MVYLHVQFWQAARSPQQPDWDHDHTYTSPYTLGCIVLGEPVLLILWALLIHLLPCEFHLTSTAGHVEFPIVNMLEYISTPSTLLGI